MFIGIPNCWDVSLRFKTFVSISSFEMILRENEFSNCCSKITKILGWFFYFYIFHLFFLKDHWSFPNLLMDLHIESIYKVWKNIWKKKSLKTKDICRSTSSVMSLSSIKVVPYPSCTFIWEKPFYCIPEQFILLDFSNSCR